jgi:hypothetical protein
MESEQTKYLLASLLHQKAKLFLFRQGFGGLNKNSSSSGKQMPQRAI